MKENDITELTIDDIDKCTKRILEDSEKIQEHNFQVYLQRKKLSIEEWIKQDQLD